MSTHNIYFCEEIPISYFLFEKKNNKKNSAKSYVVPSKFTKSVNHEIQVVVKYGYCRLRCHPQVQAYTKYHHCSLYSSWEINLNISLS